MQQRRLWLIAGALYVTAGIGGVALNVASSDDATDAATVREPVIPASVMPERPADETKPKDDADVPPPTDARTDATPRAAAAEVACTNAEQQRIADAGLAARDEVLAQIDDVKEQRLRDLGMLQIGGALPDFVTTELDSIDNAGEAALAEVDRKVKEAGKACAAGGDAQEILDAL